MRGARGPVLDSVYQTFKKYGKDNIPSVYGDYSNAKFLPEQVDLLLDVAREYGRYSSSGLVEKTDILGGPWQQVYKEGCNAVISKQSMREYFLNQPPLKTFELPPLTRSDFIGYKDAKTGNYILPTEWKK